MILIKLNSIHNQKHPSLSIEIQNDIRSGKKAGSTDTILAHILNYTLPKSFPS